MIEKKKPTAAAPEIRRYVRNLKGSSDGFEAVSAVPARRVTAGHKKPRTYVSLNPRGEVSAWLKGFLATDETVTEKVCYPRTVRRGLAVIAGTVERKKGPMGKRGRQRWITPNPTAEQFNEAVAKLRLTVEFLTSTTHKTDKLVRIRKIG